MPEEGEEMIRIFTGENRVRAKQEIVKILGEDHETIEGADLELADMPTVFLGNSLFAEVRHVLVQDLEENKPAWEKLPEYLDTPHEVIIWETKLDKRTTTYKELAKKKVEVREFAMPRDMNAGLVFDIYRTAKRDGVRAVEMLRKIEPAQDQMMFVGLMASQAIKDFISHQGVREKKALKELSKLDLELKSTAINPSWLLIEGFLIRLASL